MPSSTKIRPFSRLIDQSESPLWVIGPDGRLCFLSSAVGDWLTVEPETLVGRLCVAGTSITDDPLDFLAASLAAPPGFAHCGTASLTVQPTIRGARSRRIEAMETRFVRLGDGPSAVTLAVGGKFADAESDGVVDAAITLRQQLDSWRRHHETISESIAMGNSRAAVRMQNQIRLAQSVRADVLILSPIGCLAESLALSIHQQSAAAEPVVTIEGPLMDAELLDASMMTVVNHLSESDQSLATIILKELDETPADAQQRLCDHLRNFGYRLRMIAIAGVAPKTLVDSDSDSDPDLMGFDEEVTSIGIHEMLADRLTGLCIRLCPLSDRVADLPMIASAMLARRRASGDGIADRFSRSSLDALVIYPWPDNYRELDQTVRYAVRCCPGDVIGPEHLPLAIRSYRPNESAPKEELEIDLDSMVASFESSLINDALELSEGNRAEAARRLGISRARLLRKLDAAKPNGKTDGDSR